MVRQLELPLFPEGLFEKVKAGQLLAEINALKKQVSHEKHVKAGYVSAWMKEKRNKPNGRV